MSKSLAELRQSPHVGLPERTYSLCLASALVGEVQSLWADLQDAEAVVDAQNEGDGDKAPPRRSGQRSPAEKIRKRLGELQSEMVEHTGKLRLRGVKNSDWLEWVSAHPPRPESVRDSEYAYGICDADALLADLPRYTAAWNDEPLAPGDWDFIAESAVPGDIKTICRIVVAMHETAVDVPKLLSASLGSRGDGNG